MRSYSKLANTYADEVLSGVINTNALVRLAVQRHVGDLKKTSDPSYPYKFVPELGEKVCRFAELLPHTKGQWASRGELLVLQPWQVFLLMTIFGWVRRSNEKRRFRSVYLELSRKNGKSFLAAAIGLYMLLGDNEFGAEIYSGATSEKQAWEVFMPAKLMLARTPSLQIATGAEVCAKVLVVPRTGSKFEAVVRNPGDGPSPSCAIVDEYHEHDTPLLHDTMQTGMGAREQPLMLIVTTAGYNLASPCYDKHEEVRKVLEGLVVNDQLFGVIFGCDPEDDWADPKVLIKANPNYGISVDAEFLQSQQRQAMVNPVEQNKFKTKHLNIWCNVRQAWMNLQLWQQATDTMLEEDELIEGKVQSWIAVDLASKSDMCSEQRLYRKMVDGRPHYYLFGRYWLPEDAIDEPGPNHAHYVKWVRMGLLTQTDGATADLNMITEQVVADAKRMNPVEVVFDPFNATAMAQTLEQNGVKRLVEFTQLPQNFAVPMDEMITALKDGRFHHDGNEITAWCMSNVVARPTRKGLFAPTKDKPHQKIDGSIAAIMAFGRAIAAKERERAYQMFAA